MDYSGEAFRQLLELELATVPDYQLGNLIGYGALGLVFDALAVRTETRVALKAIEIARLPSSAQKRVQRELEILRRVNHPNLMFLIEALRGPRFVCMIMPFMPNGTLKDLVSHEFSAKPRPGALRERASRIIFGQLTNGLSYLHRSFLVHRNLTLSNVLLDENLNVRITDFSYAKPWQRGKKTLIYHCGNMRFNAPETLLGQGYEGPPSDVWSLGVILYTMIVGQHPFGVSGQSPEETQEAICNDPVQLPPTVDMSVPLISLLLRLLAKNADERISLDEVQVHQWMLCSEEPEEQRAPSLIQLFKKRPSRTRRAARHAHGSDSAASSPLATSSPSSTSGRPPSDGVTTTIPRSQPRGIRNRFKQVTSRTVLAASRSRGGGAKGSSPSSPGHSALPSSADSSTTTLLRDASHPSAEMTENLGGQRRSRALSGGSAAIERPQLRGKLWPTTPARRFPSAEEVPPVNEEDGTLLNESRRHRRSSSFSGTESSSSFEREMVSRPRASRQASSLSQFLPSKFQVGTEKDEPTPVHAVYKDEFVADP